MADEKAGLVCLTRGTQEVRLIFQNQISRDHQQHLSGVPCQSIAHGEARQKAEAEIS